MSRWAGDCSGHVPFYLLRGGWTHVREAVGENAARDDSERDPKLERHVDDRVGRLVGVEPDLPGHHASRVRA